jgi:hypothetical protein
MRKLAALSFLVVLICSGPIAARTDDAATIAAINAKPLSACVFNTEILVKRDGKWVEWFYQVTTLNP